MVSRSPPRHHQLPGLRSSITTPNRQDNSLQPKHSQNDQNSLSYSHTNKNTHKHLSYGSEVEMSKHTGNQENLEPKYNHIGNDLKFLNSKLEHLEECFLNMSTISQDKENVRPGMLKRMGRTSKQTSKENLGKCSFVLDSFKQSPHQSTKRVSRRSSFRGRSELEDENRGKQISFLKKEVSFCRKSLSASRQKRDALERQVEDRNQKIKSYKLLERKMKKVESDNGRLLKTLEKSEQVREKQRALLQKYQFQIKRLNRLVKVQK